MFPEWAGWVGLLITLIGLLITVAVVAFRMGRYFKGIESRLDSIEPSVRLLLLIHSKEIIQYYKTHRIVSLNPGPNQPEKDVLLRKLGDGTITRNEALKLEEILRQEEARARVAKAIGAIIAIGGLLLLIKIILDMLGEKK